MFAGKHILLGVTGGIAAYKAPLLVRELVKAGAEVQVVMTPAAKEFVTPLTLAVLSRREVIVEMFPASAEQATAEWTRHIELALWADVMMVAPASANTLAKLAHGLADNFLTTLVLALRCPLVLAPTMDVDMYRHEATQATIALLRERGCVIVEPAEGELASGLTGPGRLPEVEVLLSQIALVLTSAHRDLQGRRVLVTAGPTHEPIDPVRYVGNRSSGKMGFAVARAAAERGAEVTLISGPVEREAPRHVRRIDVRTATEMHEAVLREFEQADLLVMAAAVADFAPVQPVASKIKREAVTGGSLMLELKPNPDILKAVGPVKRGRLVVGFALETEAEEENARRKLVSKSLDLIVMNNPTREGSGFGGDTNVVTLLAPDGTVERLPRMPKIQVAHAILDRVVAMLTPAGRG